MTANFPPFKPTEVQFTAPPRPSFQYGQKVDGYAEGKEWMNGAEAGWKVIETAKEDPGKLYNLMTSGIVPRPIAFVTSISEEGVENLAPFSWFQMVAHNPPLIMFSLQTENGRFKDTVNNVRSTKSFTVSIISEAFIHNAHAASIDAPPGVGEWTLSGLTKKASMFSRSSVVKESAFSMECELYETKDVVHPTSGEITTTIIIGHVKYIHVRKDVLNERGNVDLGKFRPIARVGEYLYATIGTVFRIARPFWDADSQTIQELAKDGGD